MAPLISGMQRELRRNVIPVPLLQLATQVTFDVPMPDTNYEVYFRPLGTLNTSVAATNKTVNGYTLAVSLSISGSFEAFAIQNVS